MKSATRTNLALGALTLVLWLALSQQPAAERPLLTTQPVQTLRIERAEFRSAFLRDRCGWIQTEPQRIRANAESLNRLASLAAAIPHRRYKAAALATEKLGFKGGAMVTLNQQRIAFGGIEALNGWRYVRLEDGSIALLTDRFSDLLQVDLREAGLPLECPDA